MSKGYILWVDDDHQLLDHAVNRLRENGIQVLVEPNVDKAIDLIKQDRDRIKGVLLDLMLDPGEYLDGLNVEGGFETGFRVIDYLQTNGLLNGLKVNLFTNASVGQGYYSPSGTEKKFRVASKSRFKGSSLVSFVRDEFPLIGTGED